MTPINRNLAPCVKLARMRATATRGNAGGNHTGQGPRCAVRSDMVPRYIVTPETVAKHRPFCWLRPPVLSRRPEPHRDPAFRRYDVRHPALAHFHERCGAAVIGNVRMGKGNQSRYNNLHHLRDLPLPGRPHARPPRERLRRRPPRQGHRRGRPRARRPARGVAQPARPRGARPRGGPRLPRPPPAHGRRRCEGAASAAP